MPTECCVCYSPHGVQHSHQGPNHAVFDQHTTLFLLDRSLLHVARLRSEQGVTATISHHGIELDCDSTGGQRRNESHLKGKASAAKPMVANVNLMFTTPSKLGMLSRRPSKLTNSPAPMLDAGSTLSRRATWLRQLAWRGKEGLERSPSHGNPGQPEIRNPIACLRSWLPFHG